MYHAVLIATSTKCILAPGRTTSVHLKKKVAFSAPENIIIFCFHCIEIMHEYQIFILFVIVLKNYLFILIGG